MPAEQGPPEPYVVLIAAGLIISLTITAQCFGAGVAAIGLADALLQLASASDAPVALGAAACLGGAFGRTMSPVSAVVVYGSGLVATPPLQVIRHLLPALLAGGAVALAVALR